MRNNETSIPTNGQAKKYNIYLIIPDGYASTQNLKKYWDFDNTPFVNYLKDKGFFIANNSSSMLDLNYKQGVENAQWANIRAIEKNLTSRLLETNGYKYRMDIFNGKQLVSGKKRNLLSLYRCYFMQTALFKVGVWLSLYDLMDCEPISKFSTCVNLEKDLQIEEKYPRFLYTHTMFTHIPFTDTLSKTDNLEGMIEENKFITFLNDSFKITKALKDLGIEENNPLFGQYLFQIKRTNFWIKDTFDKFWQKIEKNSIVIVMSDHGSRFITGNSVEAKSEFYQNFTAVYFPDKDYTRLTDTITPINVMRMSINKAIGAELPYLLDKCIK
jgi:hypothetical protein